ncbi:conserved hypothetical protein [Desulfonatronospira thiodismutans ASO3-1]|uniref:Uncharacterized protein n=1 Tax=Desulfonatronospira thiodismutans ASO3-1 TaxID=555779 RepID=D6SR37_9BACT|nr:MULTISPECIES: hypothetical protein [Desulfonatronospira]EFI33153.1 conserved hypothetical protein [Desulfonatronospira thiodismutans ASO3-1]RQD76365.1 MAG: hypothetical protein D5S03_06450 [Desulfonatronospira sp. MSAO_Bac3]
MHVFADGISKVTLSNGNLRIMLTQSGADDSTVEAGTMIIPASQASNFLNGLANSLKELESRLKEAREAQQTQQ